MSRHARDVKVVVLQGLLAIGIHAPLVSFVVADDYSRSCKDITALVSEKKYPKALEQLHLVRKKVERLHGDTLKTFFPSHWNNFEGGSFEDEGAFGFSNLSRVYKRKDASMGDASITVTLTGGSGLAESPLTGHAAFSKRVSLGGMQENAFRMRGFTAAIENDGQPTLNVFLPHDTLLKFESLNGPTDDDVKRFAEVFPLEGLQKYLESK
jgi:hypothetical protein